MVDQMPGWMRQIDHAEVSREVRRRVREEALRTRTPIVYMEKGVEGIVREWPSEGGRREVLRDGEWVTLAPREDG